VSTIRDPRLQNFELNPSKVTPEQRSRNIRNIQAIAKNFLDAIVDSADALPLYVYQSEANIRTLREMFHHIAVCTAARFGGNATAPHIGVGSVVFLRFIGPAISIPAPSLQPEETLRPEVKRALVLVTKIIQNLASNALFTEQHMMALNPFLESNIKRVLEFIRSISVVPCVQWAYSRLRLCLTVRRR
jgi:neurofibromin 1